jgi:hypothetical protein
MPGLEATASAFQSGLQSGRNFQKERRERKEKLEDEARQQKVTDLYGRGKSLALSIKSMAQDDPARQKAMDDLTSVEQDIASIYHPDNGGTSALQKDWHLLAGLIHKSRPAAASVSLTATSPGATLKPDAQTVTLTDTPDAPIGSVLKPGGDLSASLSAVRAGTKLAPGTGTATQSVTMPSAPVTIPGTTYRPVATAMTPQQRQQIARQNAARATAEQDVEAAGLTPEQTASADSAQKLAFIQQARKDYKKLNPDPKPGEEAAFIGDLIEKTYGTAQKPVWKEYIGPNGEKQYLDATKPEAIPPGWNATGTESADTRTRADFAEYQRLHPDYKGTLQQWKVEQGQLGKLAVPTNRDDRYLAIMQKAALGQPLSKDEQAYADGYDMYVKKRITGPMLARVEAQANDRIIPVIGQDPNDPGKVTLMPAGEAAKAGVGTPASIAFQTEKAMQKYMTSGRGGENLTAFSTAVSHLNLLQQAGDALHNGDIDRANQLGNAVGVEFGDDAATNFATVKAAVAGEIAKVFTGRATVEEVTTISSTINSAQSPEQIQGAINYYIDLMGGKLGALYDQLKSAQPGGLESTFQKAQAAAAATRGGTATAPPPPPTGASADQYTYITNGTKTIRAKKGTPVPQGWTVTNAPTQ